jgi:hypothetical protein
MRVPLINSDLIVEIDDADWDLVKHIRWRLKQSSPRAKAYATNYRVQENGGKQVLTFMHRLILGIEDKSILVDHIDGNGLNNKRSNLRACSHAQNTRNAKIRIDNPTGVRNVGIWRKKNGWSIYTATVTGNGVKKKRYFKDLNEAAKWAEEVRKEMHGEFAYANA